jgi:adenylate cyclase
MPRTETTIARAALARQQEDWVLAEAQFGGEQRVAVARLLLITLVTTAIVGSRHERPDLLMTVVGPLYALFGVFWLVTILRSHPSLRKARIMPFITPTIDFGFLTLAAWRLQDRVTPEHEAALGAVYLVFSLLRPPQGILYSAVLALASYFAIALGHGTATSFGTLSVAADYVALGFLLWRSNLALRKMFISLRRHDNLSRFVAAPLVERLLAGGEAALQPVQREVTVLFLDVRNFTAFSEHLAPRAVLEFLDDLLGRMSQIVKGHEGLVNKFLGDGMLAFWGVPAQRSDHARAAMQAALDMRKELAELNGVREHHGQPAVRIGIGIHTGVVAAGMIGGADQHEYTVIGDSVNLASRIEGLTKQLGVDILVSQRAWEHAGEGFAGTRKAEEHVKGREEAVVVYALEGWAGPAKAAGG